MLKLKQMEIVTELCHDSDKLPLFSAITWNHIQSLGMTWNFNVGQATSALVKFCLSEKTGSFAHWMEVRNGWRHHSLILDFFNLGPFEPQSSVIV